MCVRPLARCREPTPAIASSIRLSCRCTPPMSSTMPAPTDRKAQSALACVNEGPSSPPPGGTSSVESPSCGRGCGRARAPVLAATKMTTRHAPLQSIKSAPWPVPLTSDCSASARSVKGASASLRDRASSTADPPTANQRRQLSGGRAARVSPRVTLLLQVKSGGSAAAWPAAARHHPVRQTGRVPFASEPTASADGVRRAPTLASALSCRHVGRRR